MNLASQHRSQLHMASKGAGSTQPLKGKRVAIIATDGFEQSELVEARRALDLAGATTKVIAPSAARSSVWREGDWGDRVAIDFSIGEANEDEYDALLIPGGVMNPDRLRISKLQWRLFFLRGRETGGGHLPRRSKRNGKEIHSWVITN